MKIFKKKSKYKCKSTLACIWMNSYIGISYLDPNRVFSNLQPILHTSIDSFPIFSRWAVHIPSVNVSWWQQTIQWQSVKWY